MRRRLGAEGTSDEELLLRWIIGKEDIDFARVGSDEQHKAPSSDQLYYVNEVQHRVFNRKKFKPTKTV